MRICIFHAGPDLSRTEMCAATVRHHNPEAEIVHLTCAHTPLVKGADYAVRLPWDGTADGAIQLRMEHLCRLDSEPAVVLDDDMLVCASLAPAFTNTFEAKIDVGLTRKGDTDKYNCGFMYFTGPRFWQSIRELCREMTPSFMMTEHALEREVRNGQWVIKEFDHQVWNNYHVDGQQWPQARIVHFKGGRKKWMHEHYERGSWRKAA